jgi:hypothetical protein
LAALLKASGFLKVDDEYMARRGASEAEIRESRLILQVAINEAMVLWHNSLRFASEARLRAFLKQIGRLRGVKGDPLKKNALDLLSAADTVIDRGGVALDIKEKIVKALNQSLEDAHMRLEDEEGVSGFVVSRRFKGVSTMDRQGMIEDALSNAPDPFTREERRRILMIAALTPVEFKAVGPRVRVHGVEEMGGGAIEVLLHGGISDAEYVRGVLNSQKGIRTTEPKHIPGALGILMYFRAQGTEADPLTKEKAICALKGDPYIKILPNA